MMSNLIRFVSVILIITLCSHGFLYFSWVRFFTVFSLKIRMSMIGVLSFFSLTFVLASLLIHLRDNSLTRAYYLFSGLWMGLFGFLLMATAVIWMIKAGLYLCPLGRVDSQRIIQVSAVVLYAAAVVYTGVCYFQYDRITIRHITVPIKNLPEAWEGRTIAHLSDLHIGSGRGQSFLERVIGLTNEQAPDIVAITGDLFDGATGSQKKYAPLLDTFTAGKGVLFTSGNHEVYSGIQITRDLIEKSSVILLDDRAIVIDGLQFLGIAYPGFSEHPDEFDFSDSQRFDSRLPTVLLYHTPTRIKQAQAEKGNGPSSDYLAPDVEFAFARSQGICLQLSGHTHAGQFFPYTWLAGWIFKGYHFGLHRLGDFYINISAGTGSWGPPLRSHHLSEIVMITLTGA